MTSDTHHIPDEHPRLDSNDPDERRWAIIDASQAADAHAAPLLIRMLDTEGEENRRHIARALGNIGGDEVSRALLRIVEYEDTMILGDALRALGSIDPQIARPHAERLASHPIEWVAQNARWVLKRCK